MRSKQTALPCAEITTLFHCPYVNMYNYINYSYSYAKESNGNHSYIRNITKCLLRINIYLLFRFVPTNNKHLHLPM